jgi:hypothetical protein
MNLRLKIEDGVSPRLAAVMKMFTGAGLASLHRAAGVEVQQTAVRHLMVIAGTRHATAQRLGAAPTGHWGKAAEKAGTPAALEADTAGATLTIAHPGIARAFRSITIVPRTSKALAIPISGISYGFRAAELWERMKLFIPKGKRIIAANIGGQLTPLYALCSSVTQRQDRSLLPSDADFQNAAVAGAKGWLASALAKGGNA